jgi:DNA replication protein DnaC
MMKTPYQDLIEKLEQLRLGAFVTSVEELIQNDPEPVSVVLAQLERMVDNELAERRQRSVERRIREAQFVRLQTVDRFDFTYNPSTQKLKKRYLQLLQAGPVEQAIGAVFLGNSGLGKTHLARALGFAACQRGHRVLFVTCATMLNRLVAADAAKILDREVKRLQSPALLVIDELAYLTMSHQEANLFFQVVSRRHDHHRPTVTTTNKPFAEWNQVFHGDATAHAIVDRLTERAEIFYLEGRHSYRQTHRQGLNANKTTKRSPSS